MARIDFGNNLDGDTAALPEYDPEKRVKIILEENEEIPPTGLPIGVNGEVCFVKPGEEVNIKQKFLTVLDNAETSAPIINPGTKAIEGYRTRLRFPYRRVQ
jgi:hypothetical protein